VKPLLARFNAILGSADHSHEEVARRVRVLHLAARRMKDGHFAAVASPLRSRPSRRLLPATTGKSGV